MATEIKFNRELNFNYGEAEQVSPMIRRIVANNPSPFTFYGTGTYVVGHGNVAVIDPGPALPEHIDTLKRVLDGETVTHIVVTHTHMDHSPAAKFLKEATGAPTYGFGPHGSLRRGPKVEEGADHEFEPDHVIHDGAVIEGDGWTLEAVHTPGHTSNHLCFAFKEENALFSGDHVMGWSTSVISPPDGDMQAYMRSLRKLLARDEAIYWPTHGAPITDPKPYVESFIAHREEREDQIMNCLSEGTNTIPAMVARMYTDVPSFLHPAAARSVLAHLVHMVETGRVHCEGPPGEHSVYSAASDAVGKT